MGVKKKSVYYRINHEDVLRLSIYRACVGCFLSIIVPHISILYASMGFSHAQIGVVLGSAGIAGFFGPLIIPRILQATQLYRLIPILIPFVCGILLLTSWSINIYIIVVIISMLYGFVFSGLQPINDSVIIHSLDNPHKHYNIVRSCGPIGYLAMSLIIMLFPVIDLDSSSSIIRTIMIASVGFLVLFFLLPNISTEKKFSLQITSHRPKNNLTHFFHDVKHTPHMFYMILVVLFLNSIPVGVINTFMYLFAKETFSVENVTSFALVSAGVEALVLQFGNRLVSRFGYWNLLCFIIANSIVRVILLSFASSLFMVYLSQILHFGSFSLMIIIVIHFINHHVDVSKKSFSTGLFWSAMAVSQFFAANIGGVILERTSFSTLFMLAIIPSVLAGVSVLIFRRYFVRLYW